LQNTLSEPLAYPQYDVMEHIDKPLVRTEYIEVLTKFGEDSRMNVGVGIAARIRPFHNRMN
jgi:hypothetical protein